MNVLIIQQPYTGKDPGRETFTQRSERFLRQHFGSGNVFASSELGIVCGLREPELEKKIRSAIREQDIDLVFLDSSLPVSFSRIFYRENAVYCLFHREVPDCRSGEKLLRAGKRNVKYSYRCIAACGRDADALKETCGREADFILPTDDTAEKDFARFMDGSLGMLLYSGFAPRGEENFRQIRKRKTDGTPLVSVIMPIYNTEKYLEAAVRSVLNQTLENFELLLVDDESTDGSAALALELAGKDARISVYAQNHAGQGTARNRAMKAAEGKYLYFLDSDDSAAPDALRLLAETAEERKTDLIYFSGEGIRVLQGEYPQTLSGREMYVGVKKQGDYEVCPGQYFFSADFCREHRLAFDEGVYHEDHLFIFSAIMQAKRAAVLKDVLLYYSWLRPGSTTASGASVSHTAGLLRFYGFLKKYAQRDDLSGLEKKMIAEERQQMLHEGRKQSEALTRTERKALVSLLDPEIAADLEKRPSGGYYIPRLISSCRIYGVGMTVKKGSKDLIHALRAGKHHGK